MTDTPSIDELAKAAVKKLQALAQAATQGEWTAEAWTKIITDSIRVATEKNFSIGGVLALLDGKEQISRDAAYIAAANPTAILAILSRVEALEGGYERGLEAAAKLCDDSFEEAKMLREISPDEKHRISRTSWVNTSQMLAQQIRALSTSKPEGGKS